MVKTPFHVYQMKKLNVVFRKSVLNLDGLKSEMLLTSDFDGSGRILQVSDPSLTLSNLANHMTAARTSGRWRFTTRYGHDSVSAPMCLHGTKPPMAQRSDRHSQRSAVVKTK